MKRILSLLLATILLAGVLPVEALRVSAAEQTGILQTTEQETPDPALEEPEELLHTHSYVPVVTEPTCQDPGYTTYTCDCGDQYVADHREALDHDFGDWYDEGQPTCQQPGTQRRDCSRCDRFEIRSVTATGHKYVPYVAEPTYTTEGYTEYICACGDSYIDERSIIDSLSLPVPQVRLQDGCLVWECEDGVDGFEIWRATSKSGKYTKVAFTESYRWEDTDYSAGKTYYYKLRSVCGASGRFISDYSNIVSVVRTCTTPEPEGRIDTQTGKILLTWAKVPGATKYEIHRSTSESGTFKKLTTTTKLTYTDTKAEIGTQYFYKVKAIASKSTYNSQFSITVCATAVCGIPAATVKIDDATGKPLLSWKAVPGAQGYGILRRVAGEETFTCIDRTEGTTYLDATAVLDTHYQYMVQALGKEQSLDGQPSGLVGVVCGLARPEMKAEANHNGKPVITWEAVEGAVSYRVYRSTSSTKSYALVATVEALSYVDESVAAGKTYYYKLVAVGREGESAQTPYLKLTGKCAVPELAVAAGTTGKPVLSWNKITGAKKYEIWRSVDGAAFKRLTTTTKTTYTDSKATSGKECTYKIRALGSGSGSYSLYSEELSCYVICAAPTLSVKRNAATGNPVLTWKKVTNAAGYKIYRSVNGGSFDYLQTVTGTTYEDDSAVADVAYSYKLQTVGAVAQVDSVDSNIKTIAATCGQAKLSYETDAAGKPVITWTAVEDAVSYRLYRSTKSSSGYKLIATQSGLSYTDGEVASGKTVYYKVVALSEHGTGDYSSYLKVLGKCAQPVISVGYNAVSGKPVVTWEKVTGARKYEVWRSTTRNDGYKKVATVTKTTYADTTAQVGQFYYYQVRAVGSGSGNTGMFSNPRGCLTVCARPAVTVKLDMTQWKPALSWNKVTAAQSYQIYRATRAGNFILLATVTGTSYTDTSARIGDTYRYQVVAVAESTLSNSTKSEQVVISLPCRKTTASVVLDASGKPTVSWEAVEGAQIYAIYRSTKKSSGFKLCTQTRDTSYIDKGAKKGTTYYYYVTAMAQDTESAKSNTVKLKCVQ